MARNWRKIRAEAIAQGRLDPAKADESREAMHDVVQARRLTGTRKKQGHPRRGAS